MLLRNLSIGCESMEAMIDELTAEFGGIHSKLRGDFKFEEIFRDHYDLVIISEKNFITLDVDTLHKITGAMSLPRIVVILRENSLIKPATCFARGCEAALYETTTINELRAALTAIISKNSMRENINLSSQACNEAFTLEDFTSESPTMKSLLQTARKVVNSRSSLLISGETGVGKELLARAIHKSSNHRHEPFIAVNCAAIPDTLLESEFFGYEKGAFTGADRLRKGVFELAHRGTIFLDEIGDMSFQLQAKLLRVLQEKRFQRLGGEKTIEINVRVIAATNYDLIAEVGAGRFRRDLYYRLCVVNLSIPPLSERREDIPRLAHYYLEFLAPRIGVPAKDISREAMKLLIKYNWPGNVRELINVMERMLLLCDNATINPADLPEEILESSNRREDAPTISVNGNTLSWKEFRKREIRNCAANYFGRLLEKYNGNVLEAAKDAKISPRALYLYCRDIGISPKSKLS